MQFTSIFQTLSDVSKRTLSKLPQDVRSFPGNKSNAIRAYFKCLLKEIATKNTIIRDLFVNDVIR